MSPSPHPQTRKEAQSVRPFARGHMLVPYIYASRVGPESLTPEASVWPPVQLHPEDAAGLGFPNHTRDEKG